MKLFANDITRLEGLEYSHNLTEFILSKDLLSEEEQKIFSKGTKAIIEHCREVKFAVHVNRLEKLRKQMNVKGLRLDDYRKLEEEIEIISKKIKDLK